MFWAWKLLKVTMVNFMSDKALSHGAAIAYYTVFAIAPLLVIVIAVAGLLFGERAAQGAIASQLSGLMGDAGARGIEALIRSASNRRAGLAATAVGFGTLILAASSVFIEMQSALNAVWKTKARHMSIRAFVRARAISFGLVVTVGFLLLVSLAVSTAISALDKYLNHFFPRRASVLPGRQFSHLFHPDLDAVRRGLQGPARQAHRLGRRADRRGHDLVPVHGRQVADRPLYRQQRRDPRLWRGGRPDHRSALGLLLGADLPARRRIHQGLCRAPRQPRARARCSRKTRPLRRSIARKPGW